jgi:hypothetical protein
VSSDDPGEPFSPPTSTTSPASACDALGDEVYPGSVSFGSMNVQVEVGPAPGTQVSGLGIQLIARRVLPKADAKCATEFPAASGSQGAAVHLPAVVGRVIPLTVGDQGEELNLTVIPPGNSSSAPVAYTWIVFIRAHSTQYGRLDTESAKFMTVAQGR